MLAIAKTSDQFKTEPSPHFARAHEVPLNVLRTEGGSLDTLSIKGYLWTSPYNRH
jgi:hypothetical protein